MNALCSALGATAFTLAAYVHFDGGAGAWPALDTLADRTECEGQRRQPWQIRRDRQTLVGLGVIEARPFAGPRGTTLVHLRPEGHWRLPDSAKAELREAIRARREDPADPADQAAAAEPTPAAAGPAPAADPRTPAADQQTATAVPAADQAAPVADPPRPAVDPAPATAVPAADQAAPAADPPRPAVDPAPATAVPAADQAAPAAGPAPICAPAAPPAEVAPLLALLARQGVTLTDLSYERPSVSVARDPAPAGVPKQVQRPATPYPARAPLKRTPAEHHAEAADRRRRWARGKGEALFVPRAAARAWTEIVDPIAERAWDAAAGAYVVAGYLFATAEAARAARKAVP